MAARPSVLGLFISCPFGLRRITSTIRWRGGGGYISPAPVLECLGMLLMIPITLAWHSVASTNAFYAPTKVLRRGVQEVWADWPVGSAVCNSARMEAAQGATSNATAVGVVGANLSGQLNWAQKHVTYPDNVRSKCVTTQI